MSEGVTTRHYRFDYRKFSGERERIRQEGIRPERIKNYRRPGSVLTACYRYQIEPKGPEFAIPSGG